MFTARDILAELRTVPFQPIRVSMSDGTEWDITHPDQAMVTRGHLIVGVQPEATDNGSIYETSMKLSILHITSIRPLRRPSRRRR